MTEIKGITNEELKGEFITRQCGECVSRRYNCNVICCSVGMRKLEGECGSFEKGEPCDDYKYEYGIESIDEVTEKWLKGR